ncbi:hypothetical protein JOF29_005232 [Kribbella aluminosa]|uniref:Uncharacterized protein n=1 Tax=Kribbella aluminosa TaxID=416017 RepID=A0ABS4UR49_9ACTN|nr:hypothetical protein [Kribbella aluminosa]MBP2354122.1 hypothetical protein [Kribbella aluminosa]
MAKMLSGILAAGAVLMALVALGIGLHWPYRIDGPGALSAAFSAFSGWLVIYLVGAILVVVDAVRLARRRDLDALQRSANLVKLVAVPFFVLNFVAFAESVLVVGSGDGDHLGIDGLLLALLVVFLTYVAMLPTSAYGVAVLVLLRKDGRIGRTFFGVNMLLHVLFVVDVLSSIVVVEVARSILGRRPPARSRNLLPGVLATGSAVALVWLALVATFAVLHYDEYPTLPRGFLMSCIWLLGYGVFVEFLLLVVVPVVPLVTFRAAVRLFVQSDTETLARTARTVKLVMIPLFLQNFILCAAVVYAVTILPIALTGGRIGPSTGTAVAFIGAFTLTGLIPAVIGTYLMLLPTSIYSITYLTLRLRHHTITPRSYLLHTLLQLLFVTDIISTVALTQKPQPRGSGQAVAGSNS